MDTEVILFAVLQYICFLFALCVHEAAHAAMANYCGDPTGRLLGRLTLNPVKHADPIGTVLLPLIMLLGSGGGLFGWAKPVPFNPRNLNNMRRDPMLVALAGPGSNLLMALLVAVVFRLLLTVNVFESDVISLVFGVGNVNARIVNDTPIFLLVFVAVLKYMLIINLLLLLFNLIPVPPLDGHYVLDYILPPSGQQMLQQIGPFGILIAIMVARPWLSFALPKLESAMYWFITFGQV